MKKKFCILIPSFNSKEHEVINTFSKINENYNILVVDDGSDIPFEDSFGFLLNKFKNLRVHRLNKNVGIETALRLGTELVADEFEYIARLDIGDKSPSDRFEKQFRYLDNNPECVLVGAWARFVDTSGDVQFISKVPVNDNEIRKKMFINNMFIHPVVMMRCDALIKCGGYRKKYISCEDYDLFFRIMMHGKVKNLPEELIDYEINFSSISSKKRNTQVINRLKIILANFSFVKHGIYPYYGLLRNLLMLFISRDVTTKIRKFIGR